MGKEFSVEELQALMKSVADNRIGELLVENENHKVRIRSVQAAPVCAPTVEQAPLPAAAPAASPQDITTVPAGEGKCVTSPLVGTFYASSAPDKPPFVQVGQQIHKGDVLFIVESMKVMNEVPSELDGIVAEIMVDNGQPVEYGQPVIRME